MQTGDRITIRHVATEAGVSIATVSKFMNGLQRFSPAVEEKIRTSIENLGYQMNPAAQSMVTGKTRMLGLAIVDIYNPYFASIVKGANRAAINNNYNLLVVDLEEHLSNNRALLYGLIPRVDGMILTARIPGLSADTLTKFNKPVVCYGMNPFPGIPTIRADGSEAAAIIGKYLLSLNKKRIVYAGYPGVLWNSFRISGLSAALEGSGASFEVHNVTSLTMEAGQDAARQMFSGGHYPDAVIGGNDEVAIGIIRGALSMGLRVPEDIAVAGLDNIPVSQYITPALTTVDTCAEEIGEASVDMMISIISGGSLSPENVLLRPKLIIRASA